MQFTDLPEGRLAYLDQGEGTPLLLVHGFPLDHSMWSAQIEALSNSFRVLVPDLRGFGKSFAVGDSQPSIKTYADDLALFLDALQIEKTHFCGLSMGGYVGWQWWAHYPQRTWSLVICDSRADNDAAEVARGRLVMAERVLKDGTDFVADGLIPKLFAPQRIEEESDCVQATRRVIKDSAPEAIAFAQRAMASREDFTDRLAGISVPTLVICGEHDVITPPSLMKDMAKMIPEASFVEIPGAGHMAPLESPQRVNEAMLEFLT